MNHKQLIEKYKKIIDKEFKGEEYLFYKIPDCRGLGGIRPFDAFLLLKGFFFAFEFKAGRDSLKKHQSYYLDKVKKAGSFSLVVNEKTDPQTVLMLLKLSISRMPIFPGKKLASGRGEKLTKR